MGWGKDLVPGSILVTGVINYPKNISAQIIPEIFSIYTDFKLFITIFGEDDQLYTVNNILFIYDSQEYIIGYNETFGGLTEFNGYLTSTNITSLIVECEYVYETVNVDVYPLYANFSLSKPVSFIQPKYTSDSFYLSGSIVDIHGQVESKNYYDGEYSLIVNVKNQDENGETAILYDLEEDFYEYGEDFYIYTDNGTYVSHLYSFVTPGLFSVSIYATDPYLELVPALLGEFEIVANLSEVLLSISESHVSIYRPVDLIVEIKSGDSYYYSNTSVSIFNELGELLAYCTTFEGMCNIEYYPSTLGNFSIHAEAKNINSNSVNLTVDKWILYRLNELVIFT